MKRIGNIYENIISIDNLLLADKKARAGKSKQRGIISFDKNFDQNIADIYRELVTGTYKTSEYRLKTIHEPKQRMISIAQYRDRIVQHAVMNQLEDTFVKSFTSHTYSCIKGRGIHAASFALRKALKDVDGTTYCLKLDIQKYYPSVDHGILKSQIRRKIKDQELLNLLDGIIDSAPGLPIGNLLSQYFANFYLNPFDHQIKAGGKVLYCFRYLDDIVILSPSKDFLLRLLIRIKNFLWATLRLTVKSNHQIFPVASRGIDFVGYVHYHDHVLLRKTIKKSFARAVKRNKGPLSIASYKGWAKHCNSRHLIKKLFDEKI